MSNNIFLLEEALDVSDEALGQCFIRTGHNGLLVPSSPGNLYVTCYFDGSNDESVNLSEDSLDIPFK